MITGALINEIQGGAGNGSACLEVLNPIPAGAPLLARDVGGAPCSNSPEQPFYYDTRLSLSRARNTLAAGTVIQNPPSFAISTIAPGQHVKLRAHVGPVLIERDVEALQAARPGARLFVRDEQGDVFSVSATDLAP